MKRNENVFDQYFNVISLLIFILGGAGMTVSLPFMFSSQHIDVMGAGLSFIAGATMLGAGLVSLGVGLRLAPSGQRQSAIPAAAPTAAS
ncbi:MAG: hypothetical protein JRH20_21860 [Deltaproteobacteria bacterium]|nr:hypothetical protein [Deltaproteobacteria bacterium]